ncbi:MAG TPA: hypothetical protein VFX59_26740, partial [Polyangiales bacterium]|nr:hypothetical protein [Polyangiales bacterium]
MKQLDMDEALRVQRTVQQAWLSIPGVVGIDVALVEVRPGVRAPALRVFVSSRDRAGVKELPAELDGVPVVIIE